MSQDPRHHTAAEDLPDLADEYWAPLWETCSELGLPINFHVGANPDVILWSQTQSWPSLAPEVQHALNAALLTVNNARVIGNLLYSGLPERYPNLKFVSVESGVGWIPPFL